MLKVNNLNFGEAIEKLKSGEKVYRNGWNGKGIYIFMFFGLEHFSAKEPHQDLSLRDSIYMKTAQNDLAPWTASQPDVLAEDWELI